MWCAGLGRQVACDARESHGGRLVGVLVAGGGGWEGRKKRRGGRQARLEDGGCGGVGLRLAIKATEDEEETRSDAENDNDEENPGE